MKSFDLIPTKTAAEACSALADHAEDGKLLAGGVALLIVLKQRIYSPAYLIDIGSLNDLNFIREDSGGLTIGALTPHRAIETHPVVTRDFPLLRTAFHSVGTIRIRNQGTLGGNLCFAEPAADPPSALLVMEAELTAQSAKGSRKIPMAEFIQDYYETSLRPDELLTQIRIPRLSANFRTAYTKFTTRSKEDKPCLSVAVGLGLEADGKTCRSARIAVGAAIPAARRMHEAEEYLKGKQLTEAALREAGERAKRAVDCIDDIRGSAEYRREMVGVFVRRTLQKALSGQEDGHP